MKLPPWAYIWIVDHWFVSAGLVALALVCVYTLLRSVLVNFLKIFHRRPIVINVNVTQPNATTEQIQEAVRTEVQTLNPRRIPRGVGTRLQSIINDD